MKLVFGALVTIVLLVIYIFLVVRGIEVVQCILDDGCKEFIRSDFTDQMALTLALIGGLISASSFIGFTHREVNLSIQ